MRRKVLFWIYNAVVTLLPGGRCSILKVWWLRAAGVRIGARANLGQFVRFFGRGEITIGNNVWINTLATVESGSRVVIGDDVEINTGTLLSANGNASLTIERGCHIAHNVSIKCSAHKIDLRLLAGSIAGESVFKDIVVGEGTWVCSGVTVIPGVHIGPYNVIAAGAVMTRDSPPGVLMAGVPAEIKKIYPIQKGTEND